MEYKKKRFTKHKNFQHVFPNTIGKKNAMMNPRKRLLREKT